MRQHYRRRHAASARRPVEKWENGVNPSLPADAPESLDLPPYDVGERIGNPL
jgi:hypothetical protein